MLTIFSDLYLKLFYTYLKEEEELCRESEVKRKSMFEEDEQR